MPRPFEPIGDVARWRTLYEVLSSAKVDDVVTYADMAEALELDAERDRQAIRSAVTRAATELLEVDKHAIEAVPDKGYRIVKPAEHLVLAQRRSKKAERSIVKSRSHVVNVDFNDLEEGLRSTFETVGRVLGWQLSMMRQLDIRQRDLEDSLASVQATVEQTARDQKSHEERLAWLEQRQRLAGGVTETA